MFIKRLSCIKSKSKTQSIKPRSKQKLNYSTTEIAKKSSVIVSIPNKHGTLLKVLSDFNDYGINLNYIQSRSDGGCYANTLFLKFDGGLDDPKIQELMEKLKEKTLFIQPVDSYEVPFYPKSEADLDVGRKNCIMSGALEADHPGFNDPVYKKRRDEIAQIAAEWKYGNIIPRVKYTESETATWQYVFDQLMELFPTHPCSQYQTIFPLLIENCGMHRKNIPQLEDISQFLKQRTGFTLAPVSGLLSPRDFLNALAFRSFSSTQYIRHGSSPVYTPEPDIVHELLGHVPLLADPEFADFSQAIGLASLGATEDDIKKLATCYWFTIEFGLIKQNGAIRAVGAGLLSSYGELKYSLSDKPKIRKFDPFVMNKEEYPITEYQPVYYVADSFVDMTNKLNEFAKSLQRPFEVVYNPHTKTVTEIDLKVPDW